MTRLLTMQPPFHLRSYLRRPARSAGFPLPESQRLYNRGRHALWHGLRALGVQAGDDLLVPALHCSSVVEAVLQTGLTCKFYDVNDQMEPERHDLEELIGERTRGLLLTHYLGFPQDVRRWREWCDGHGILMIEDAAHTWSSEVPDRPIATLADMAISCPYKFFGCPTVAVLTLRSGSDTLPQPRTDPWQFMSLHVVLALNQTELGRRALQRRAADHLAADASVALGNPNAGPSLSSFLLERLAATDIHQARRRNFVQLLDSLSDLVPDAFAALPRGVCPWALPIQTSSQGAMTATLARHGIRCMPLWPEPHPAVDDLSRPGAERWRSSTICLPVHQGLRAADMRRICDTARQAHAS